MDDRFISLTDLRKRWKCNIQLIESFLRDGYPLHMWTIEHKLTSSLIDKEVDVISTSVTERPPFFIRSESEEESKKSFFELAIVQEIERDYPALLHNSDSDEGKNNNNKKSTNSKNNTQSSNDAKQTEAATNIKQEKVLQRWKAAFKIMLLVIQQCHADGPKKRTKRELQGMCSKHGGKITEAQLEFLRECLGADHINLGDGPPSQN